MLNYRFKFVVLLSVFLLFSYVYILENKVNEYKKRFGYKLSGGKGAGFEKSEGWVDKNVYENGERENTEDREGRKEEDVENKEEWRRKGGKEMKEEKEWRKEEGKRKKEGRKEEEENMKIERGRREGKNLKKEGRKDEDRNVEGSTNEEEEHERKKGGNKENKKIEGNERKKEGKIEGRNEEEKEEDGTVGDSKEEHGSFTSNQHSLVVGVKNRKVWPKKQLQNGPNPKNQIKKKATQISPKVNKNQTKKSMKSRIQNHNSPEKRIQKNPARDTKIGQHTGKSNSEIIMPYIPKSKKGTMIFPSVQNCTRKKLNNGNHGHETNEIYPCKRYRPPNARDHNWPIAIKPSYGSVLKELLRTHVYEDEQEEELLKEQVKVQEERLRVIAQTCERYPEMSDREYLSLVWDAHRKPPIVYCPVYKAGSTTWMTYFMRLAHVNENNPLLKNKDPALRFLKEYGGGHKRVWQDFPEPERSREKKSVFEKSIRFLVIRHPFTRLLSAYRDKIERPKPLPFRPYFQHLQKAIVSKYRFTDKNRMTGIDGEEEEKEEEEEEEEYYDDYEEEDANSQPTFSEFVDYIIDFTRNLKTSKDWQENIVCWLPYWVQCGVCASDYQAVIKLETMKADEQFLAYAANLTEIKNIFEWRNSRGDSPSSTSFASKYFKTLSVGQVLALYERFRLDFELFGYSVDEYLDMAREE